MTTVFYDDQGRPEPPFAAGEAATLLGFLDFLRATIEWKTADLDTAALHRRLPGHPSAMTLGGLLKHLAFVEFWWFEAVALGEPTSAPWVGADFDADPDWDWHSAAQDSAADLRALWQGQVERSRQIVVDLLAADGDDGDAALARAHRIREGRDPVSLRWILTHMIEEYGRHAGHADLLREGIDGQTGE
ncbi:DinB family protein [Micrococcus luteus]|uniref:DinB family protein n=1 Tax=Micrococcus luteus TaxID=1270 RepID=UPI002004059E|nr:DinB family protein [Micrococcus luteus]MCK6214828.1 DinB family protein [Micrococcus luteus]